MSVDELAAALERVMALQPTAELQDAALLLDEAHSIMANCAQGSSATELPSAVAGLDQARDAVLSVYQACGQVRELLERYLVSLGASGADAAIVGPEPSTRPEAPPPMTPTRLINPALIAEVRRQGHKITLERVVRIGRDRQQRVVWLEEGNERAGLQHILGPKRVAQFEDAGVAKEDITDVVFTAATERKPIGVTGKDRNVYVTTYHGRTLRVAVTVSNNGYIVSANPVSTKRKLKPLQ
jgi:hypothetical protein